MSFVHEQPVEAPSIAAYREEFLRNEGITNIYQDPYGKYASDIDAQLRTPITFVGEDSEEQTLYFDYPGNEGTDSVAVRVDHAIRISYPYKLTDQCGPEDDHTFWHEYSFFAQQISQESLYDEEAAVNTRTLHAHFVHPVENRYILDRARVVSKLATMAAGWALPYEDRQVHDLTYSDGSCCEYAYADDLDNRLAVYNEVSGRIQAHGMYDARTMTKLLSNWDAPNSGPPLHNEHVAIKARLPDASRKLAYYSDDLAMIAMGCWVTFE